MAFKGKWIELIEYIAKRMEDSLGLRGLMSGEKAHQVFWNVYLGLNNLYNVYSEKEMNQGFSDLVMLPLLLENPGMKYAYIIEIKYIKPSDYEPEKPGKIQTLIDEAERQLAKYSQDEKFNKSIGNAILKKLILVFSGNKLVHHSELL